MDPTDFAIYRYLSPGGEARFWAGRRVIDPTIPARQIAERVGISENGVRARIRGLAARGFLRGQAVTPNPSLFGARVYVVDLPVKDSGEVERILRDLALVEGVIFARDIMDEDERKIRVHIASQNDPSLSRRIALLRRLSPTEQLRPPQLYWIPACDRNLTPLDGRVLRALWAKPQATMAELATSVGISLKTTASRFHQLVGSRACWWTHGPDSEELPLALVWIYLRGAADRDSVSGLVGKSASEWMPVASDGLGLDPHNSPPLIAGLVPADAPAAIERLLRSIAAAEGVLRVRRTFALGSMSYSSWFAEQLGTPFASSR